MNDDVERTMLLVNLHETNPMNPALIEACSGRVWTYASLRSSVSELSKLIRSTPRSLVFCFCRNVPATVIQYLAAIESDCVTVLLDAHLGPELARDLANRYQPQWLLGASEPVARACSAVDVLPTELEAGETPIRLHRTEFWNSPPVLHPELVLLLSTSGSTGSPKLVKLRRESVEHNAHAIAVGLDIVANERPITSLPLHYSYGLSVLNSHLHRGACVVLTDHALTAQEFWIDFRRYGCTSLAGVPFSYQILRRLNLDKLDVPTLRTLTQAGGRLDPPTVAHFCDLMRRRGGRFFVMYGQTEATARITILPSDRLQSKPGSVGLPIQDGCLEIEVSPTDLGAAGEVVYRGPDVMMGYAESRADLARDDELNGVLRTGDLGYLDDEGFLYLVGRSRRIAKVYGLRINLDEIEAYLQAHGPTAVVGGEDQLIIFCEHGDEVTFAELRRSLADRLRIHHQALVFHRVASLPRGTNGKVDYPSLQKKA
jgi:acyl-CoA synthetase (AMP-forming)/AMP-acid ligase II